MTRTCLLRLWFGLPGEGCEGTCVDFYAMRGFLGVGLAGGGRALYSMTLCRFRGRMEQAGVDTGSGPVHTIEAAAANVANVVEACARLRSDDSARASCDCCLVADFGEVIERYSSVSVYKTCETAAGLLRGK